MTEDNKLIFNLLHEMHKDAKCELNYKTPFELIIAVVLSAQCTDVRVNKVTEQLFKIASTPKDFIEMPLDKLEGLIFSCGFYHNKALAIKDIATEVEKIGYVPSNRDELMSLKGVGRKTANVVCAEAFGQNTIAVDTHVFRVSNRIGIVNEPTPEKTELALMKAFDEDLWPKLHHALIFHGRYICKSQKPNCGECLLKQQCKFYKEEVNK